MTALAGTPPSLLKRIGYLSNEKALDLGYTSTGYATLLVVAALTVYGFWTSLGSRPILTLDGADD